MPLHLNRSHGIALLAAMAMAAVAPAAAWAQAAVLSDQPGATRSGTTGTALPPGTANGADRGTLPTPNPATAPGAPGTTGTGAAGTGPSGTMAAPGR